MRLWTLVCLSMSVAAMAQPRNRAEIWLMRDYGRLKEVMHQASFLPGDLQGEVAVMDSVLTRICSDPNSDVYCRDVSSKMVHARTELLDIAAAVQALQGQIQYGRQGYNHLVEALAKSPNMTRETYKNLSEKYMQPHLQMSETLLRRIRKREGRLLKAVFSYLQKEYWSNHPLITTAVREYLAQTRAMALSEAVDSLQQRVQGLQRETSLGKMQLDTLRLHFTQLKHKETDLEKRAAALWDENNKLAAEKQSVDRSLQGASEQLNTILSSIRTQEIRWEALQRQAFWSKWQSDSLFRLKQHQIQQLTETEHRSRQQLAETETTLEGTARRLRDTMQVLDKYQRELHGVQTELDKSRLNAQRLRYLLSLLAVVTILQLFFRLRLERRHRQRLQQNKLQLEEKGIKLTSLLRELHHRTKNNLQEISSLLYLQSKDTDDAEAKEVLAEARTRIDALGMVHRQLYQDESQRFDAVQISTYVRDLVQGLLKGNNYSQENMALTFDLPDVYVPTDTVVHIGLIINELVQNCCKYAFLNQPTPKLHIALQPLGDQMQLIVRDNGPGFPPDFDINQAPSFGLKLVNMLSQHTLCAYNQDGAVMEATLSFDFRVLNS